MPILKRIATLALVGAAFGFLLWSIAGQGAVSVLFGSVGGSFTCRADVEQGLQQFVRMQLYSAVAGAVLVPTLAWFAKRSLSRRRAEKGTSAGAPS